MRIGGCHRTSLVDFPGRVAAVVFTQGCNFRCPWCHNRQLVDPHRFGAPLDTAAVLEHLARRVGKLTGVVVSGGEPTLQRGLASFLSTVKDLGFATKLDTNGSDPAKVEELLESGLVDFVALDLKAPWRRYDEACGTKVETVTIRDTIDLLRRRKVAHQLRTTEWTEFDDEERREMARIAEGSPWVRQSYRPPRADDFPLRAT